MATAIISRPSSVWPTVNTFTRGLRGGEQTEVFVDVLGVRQYVGRAGDVPENLGRRGHGLRGGKIVDQRRDERGIGRVFVDVVGVFLIDWLLRITGEVGVQGLRGE